MLRSELNDRAARLCSLMKLAIDSEDRPEIERLSVELEATIRELDESESAYSRAIKKR